MKRLFTLLIVFLFSLNVNATHLMGGELIVQNDQPGNYEILLTLYRDTLGIPMQQTQNISNLGISGPNSEIPYGKLVQPKFPSVFKFGILGLAGNFSLCK